jgi:hypothetical protein
MTFEKPLNDISSHARDLRVAVIREEFVALTHDPLVAVVLNQLVYWTQRVKDFDFFLQEEKSLYPNCTIQPRHGWIYKTAEELIQETMFQVSKSTMLRYLNTLLTSGWIDKRTNSTDKWDRTTQYRVNLRKLQEDLARIGYTLPGSTSLMTSSPLKPAETPMFRNENSKFENETSMFQNETSKFQNRTSNTKTTTKTIAETTNKEHTPTHACDLQKQKNAEAQKTSPEKIPQTMLDLWKQHVGQESLFLTAARKTQLPLLLKRYFREDIAEWEAFCKRIKASPFLMGEGARKWRVSLDWVLYEANLRKVLEGNYDTTNDGEDSSSRKATGLSLQQKKHIQDILQRIEDPIWKKWCTRLPFNPHFSSYVIPWKLEEIVDARFLGFEDERLAWIACQDARTLSRIGDLRFQLLTAIQKTYPKVSAIRTCLEGEIPALQESLSSVPENLSQPSETVLIEGASFCPLGDPTHEN